MVTALPIREIPLINRVLGPYRSVLYKVTDRKIEDPELTVRTEKNEVSKIP